MSEANKDITLSEEIKNHLIDEVRNNYIFMSEYDMYEHLTLSQLYTLLDDIEENHVRNLNNLYEIKRNVRPIRIYPTYDGDVIGDITYALSRLLELSNYEIFEDDDEILKILINTNALIKKYFKVPVDQPEKSNETPENFKKPHISLMTTNALTVLLIALKLTNTINWSWWAVLAMWWVPVAILTFLTLLIFVSMIVFGRDTIMDKVNGLRDKLESKMDKKD